MAKKRAPGEKTGLGKFISKAALVVPDILDVGMDVLTGTNPLSAIGNKLKEVSGESAAKKAIYEEFRMKEMEFEKDMFELRVRDRESARNREIEVRKTGKFDFLYHLTGIIGLGVFVFLVYVIVFVEIPSENSKIFYHLLGIVEGVVLSIFAYFFGSSKGSKEKDKILSEK